MVWKMPITQRGQRKRQCRFDLVIYENGEATRIIEVKSARIKHKTDVTQTRQGHNYAQFGIPVTFVYGMDDANQFIRDLEGA